MCFSTNASFVASAILVVVGVASIKKIQMPSQVMFACIPIVFSFQQFIEGFVWITLTNNNYTDWQNIPIYIFVIFAQVVWPIWVPLSFLLIEKNINRKKALSIIVGIGSLLSLYHLYCLIFYNASATITPNHIYYVLDFPKEIFFILNCFYLLTIIIPPFVSSTKRMSIFGVLLLISFLISKLYFNDYIISVWCFFAALISGVVFLIMKNLKEEDSLTEIFPRLQSNNKNEKMKRI
jgi:hypothetical protein